MKMKGIRKRIGTTIFALTMVASMTGNELTAVWAQDGESDIVAEDEVLLEENDAAKEKEETKTEEVETESSEVEVETTTVELVDGKVETKSETTKAETKETEVKETKSQDTKTAKAEVTEDKEVSKTSKLVYFVALDGKSHLAHSSKNFKCIGTGSIDTQMRAISAEKDLANVTLIKDMLKGATFSDSLANNIESYSRYVTLSDGTYVEDGNGNPVKYQWFGEYRTVEEKDGWHVDGYRADYAGRAAEGQKYVVFVDEDNDYIGIQRAKEGKVGDIRVEAPELDREFLGWVDESNGEEITDDTSVDGNVLVVKTVYEKPETPEVPETPEEPETPKDGDENEDENKEDEDDRKTNGNSHKDKVESDKKDNTNKKNTTNTKKKPAVIKVTNSKNDNNSGNNGKNSVSGKADKVVTTNKKSDSGLSKITYKSDIDNENNLEEIGNNVAEDDIDYALNDTKITKEDNEVSDKDSVEIGNENVPLAIDKEEHHNCIIHWIILILTIIAGVYNLVRAIMRSQNDEEDNVDKDDVKMYQEV